MQLSVLLFPTDVKANEPDATLVGCCCLTLEDLDKRTRKSVSYHPVAKQLITERLLEVIERGGRLVAK